MIKPRAASSTCRAVHSTCDISPYGIVCLMSIDTHADDTAKAGECGNHEDADLPEPDMPSMAESKHVADGSWIK